MMTIIRTFFLLVMLLSISTQVSLLFKRKIDETIAPVIFFIIVLLYCSGLLLGNLLTGIILVVLLFVITLFFLIYNIFKAKSDPKLKNSLSEGIKQYILTPGLAIWGILFVSVYFICDARIFYSFDEFSHWGLVVKNMFFFNRFGNYNEATTLFKGYPPGTALWQYFVSKLLCKSFSENHVYQANDWLIISMQVFFLKGFSNKMKKEAAFSIVLMMLIPSFFGIYLTTLYVDAILGIMFAFILIAGFLEEKYDAFFYITITLATTVLCLTKAVGIFLALCSLLIIASHRYFQLKHSDSQSKGSQVLLLAVSGVTGMCLGKLSWIVYLKKTNTSDAWNTNELTFSNLISFIKGDGEAYQYETLKNFLRALLQQPIGVKMIITVSYIGWLAIAVVFLGIIKGHIKDEGKKKTLVFYGIGCVIFSLFYASGLLVLYLFTYSPFEATNLASFSRYVNTIVIGMFLFLSAAVLTSCFNQGIRIKSRYILLCCALFAVFLIYRYPKVKNQEKNRMLFSSQWRLASNSVEFDNKKDRVHFISQYSTGLEFHYFRLEITPMHTSGPWSIGTPRGSEDLWTSNITCEQWQSMLQDGKFTYVYLNFVDEQFKTEFSDAFSNPDQIDSHCLYSVGIENGVALLDLVK